MAAPPDRRDLDDDDDWRDPTIKDPALVESLRGLARSLRLLAFGRDNSVTTFELPDRGIVTIGRGEAADVRLADPSMSRFHASLHIGAGSAGDVSLEVEDLGSSNGTRVGGRRIEPGRRHAIRPGEAVEIGAMMIIVQLQTVESSSRGAARPRESAKAAQDRELRSSSIVVRDPAMDGLYRLLDRIAPSDLSVLITGETGVGKEVMAETVHRRSSRRDKPFVRLNCAALSEALLESELFGHERGAFTGAVDAKPGLLEAARGGTVLLDEIGELPLSIQAKLLRVLEDREIRRVGGIKSTEIDVRFVSATNRDLDVEIARERFRRDLYYRLNGVSLVIPPLRERKGEIEALARSFASAALAKAGRDDPPFFTEAALGLLRDYSWPGNIRELKNLIERAVLLAGHDPIDVVCFPAERMAPPRPPLVVDLPPSLPTRPELVQPTGPIQLGARPTIPVPPSSDAPIDEERRRIIEALDRCGGNQTKAAKLLGMARNTLASRLDAYGIARPKKERP